MKRKCAGRPKHYRWIEKIPEVTHFKISGITHGTLTLEDGVTPVDNGDYITVAQGAAGLRFTPAADSTTDGQFGVESSTDSYQTGRERSA